VNAREQIAVCAVQQSTGDIHAALLSPQPSKISPGNSVLTSDAAPHLSVHARRLLARGQRMKSGASLERLLNYE
jgi:hypothetical protein